MKWEPKGEQWELTVTQSDIHQLYPGYLPWGRECDPFFKDEESMKCEIMK